MGICMVMADSQPLFTVEFQNLVKEFCREGRASYIGASNGNKPEYYDIFTSAMELSGITDCHMISHNPGSDEQHILNTSGLILLAGGNVERGLQFINSHNLGNIIKDRYREGAVIIGVSAGSIQLGIYSHCNEKPLGILPFIFDCHDESNNWLRLKRVYRETEGPCIGVPFGSMLVTDHQKIYKTFGPPLYYCS